jgi:hypothetical protein
VRYRWRPSPPSPYWPPAPANRETAFPQRTRARPCGPNLTTQRTSRAGKVHRGRWCRVAGRTRRRVGALRCLPLIRHRIQTRTPINAGRGRGAPHTTEVHQL